MGKSGYNRIETRRQADKKKHLRHDEGYIDVAKERREP